MGFSARVGLVVLVTGAVCLACRPEATAPDQHTPRPAASLLAVGDTGSPRGLLPFVFDGQLAVGAAMQRAHEANPVDAVVLLGDNFYPDGLRSDELAPRILANVARPYCAFVEPSAALSTLIGEGCSPAREAVPRLLVALGNHDLQTPGSAELQQNEVPRFVLNWEVPTTRVPAVRELPGGLSLVFLDTEWPWGPEEVDALASALEAARGPWRVIVGHRPPIAGHPQLSKMIERAAQRSGRVIHAYLAVVTVWPRSAGRHGAFADGDRRVRLRGRSADAPSTGSKPLDQTTSSQPGSDSFVSTHSPQPGRRAIRPGCTSRSSPPDRARPSPGSERARSRVM